MEQRGLLKNTVVIFESEHGESLGERKYIAHYDIYDEGVHVPLVIRSPRLGAGRRVPSLASSVDVFPTILEHLDIPLPTYPIDGLSLIDHKQSRPEPANPRDFVLLNRVPLWESVLRVDKENSIFSEFKKINDEALVKDYGIRTQDSSLIHRRARFVEELYSSWTFISGKKITRPEFEFYDLVSDPKQLNPLPVVGEKAEKLKTELLKFEADIKARSRRTVPSTQLQDYR